jgi:hypothetical protein
VYPATDPVLSLEYGDGVSLPFEFERRNQCSATNPSGRLSFVLVGEPSEHRAADERARGVVWGSDYRRWDIQPQGLMRARLVVVVDELMQHVPQVALVPRSRFRRTCNAPPRPTGLARPCSGG